MLHGGVLKQLKVVPGQKHTLICLPIRPRLDFKLKLCLTEKEVQKPTAHISLSKDIYG